MPGFWKHIFLKWPLFLISTLRVAFYHLRGWQSLLHYQVVPNSVQNSLTWQIALLKSCVLYRVWHLQNILTQTNVWLKKYTKTFWFGRASEQSVPSPPPPALFLLLPPPFSSFLVLASSSSRAVSLLISPLLNLSTSVSSGTCPDFFLVLQYSSNLGWLWLMTKWLPGKLESPCHQLMRFNGRCCTELFEHFLQLLPSFMLLPPLLVETFQKGQGWPKQKCLNMCKGAKK